MSNWKKALTIAASVGVLGMVLAGCGTSPANNSSNGNGQTGKPVEGGSIVLDETQGLKDLDPALSYDTQSDEIVEQLYDRLITYAPGTNNTALVAMDATELPTKQNGGVTNGGKTYTFHIRPGLKFWNGDPVTSQSFAYEIQRVDTKSLGSGGYGFLSAITGATDFYNGKAKTIKGISTPDQNTLVINLDHPDAQLLDVLAMPFFAPVDKKFIDSVGAKAFDSTKAMGNGPFELQSIDSNGAVLTKNPNYWMKDKYGQKLPYLNKVTFRINTNAQLDALNFEQGKTAFLGMQQGIPSTAYPHFVSTPSLKALMIKVQQTDVFYLGLNCQEAPFNNVTVRKAVEYAINKQNIIKLVNGRGVIANQPLPPDLPGYVSNLPADATYTYDPTKAKALLKQSGVDLSKPVDLYSANDPDSMKLAESEQQDLQNIGFKVNIKSYTWTTFLDYVEKGKTQMFDLGWFQDYPDAGDFLMLFETNQQPFNNSVMYSNKKVDQWMAESDQTNDKATRVQLFQKVTDQVMADAAWVPQYYPIAYFAVQNWVHGFYAPAANMDPLQTIWIDPSHSQN